MANPRISQQNLQATTIMIDLPPELVIGVPSIDSEHYDLILLLDRLICDSDDSAQAESSLDALEELGQQLAHHFDSEEHYLLSCGMPQDDVAAHIQAHVTILGQYAKLAHDPMANEPAALSRAAGMIRDWILGHLLEHDVKIRQYVTA